MPHKQWASLGLIDKKWTSLGLIDNRKAAKGRDGGDWTMDLLDGQYRAQRRRTEQEYRDNTHREYL